MHVVAVQQENKKHRESTDSLITVHQLYFR